MSYSVSSSGMAAASNDDGSEDVADFLERIKELGDKRQREDEERTRKLEEEILQGRKERQARRAERARSISPTKGSPLAISSSLQNTPDRGSPSSRNTESVRTSKDEVTRASVDADSSIYTISRPSPPPISSLSRSNTLSWQQRPASRGSGVRSRPLSLIATENAARSPRASPEPRSEEKNLSLSEKARALESKDPSWFRQTPDRGANSAAYRKNQDSQDSFSSSIRLPGLSRDSSIEPDNMSNPERSSRANSPHGGSTQATPTSIHRQTPSSSSISTAKSPFPTSASQRFAPPDEAAKVSGDEQNVNRSPTMSPSQGRISPDRLSRPSSPTKGLGGFVQSAMLKRSDSVNKRLSQQTPGLNRGNSIAGNRGSPAVVSKPSNLRGDGQNTGKSTITSNESIDLSSSLDQETQQEKELGKDDGFVKPALPNRSSQTSENDQKPVTAKTPETKRFSHHKQSWLEAAINRPEPQKIKPAAPKQPQWMENIAKAKQARAESVDLDKSVSHKEVSVGGLMRSTPIVVPSPSPTRADSPHRFSVSSTAQEPVFSTFKVGRHKTGELSSPEQEKREELLPKDLSVDNITSESVSEKKSATLNKEDDVFETPKVAQRPVVKPKPATPPKTDFRSSLRSRPTSDAKGSGDEPEFKKAFSNLRRAETKNYVAPDELKDNILRGKTALNVTGGPKKTVHVDEFKESIVKKKTEMEPGKSALITGSFLNKSGAEKGKPPVPEALAKRQLMSSKPSSSPAASEKPVAALPEALAKRQMMNTRFASSASNETLKPLNIASTASGSTVSTSNKPLDTNSGIADSVATSDSAVATKSFSPVARPSQPPVGAPIASRFNSALAGIIGRGPPTSAAKSSTSGGSKQRQETAESSEDSSDVQHVTKGRARGPKRRAAKSPLSGASSPEPTYPLGRQAQATPRQFASISDLTQSKLSANTRDTDVSPMAKSVHGTNQNFGLAAHNVSSPKTPPATKPKRVASMQKEYSPSLATTGLGISSSETKETPSSTIDGSRSPNTPPVPAKKPGVITRAAAAPKSVKESSAAYQLLSNFFQDAPGSIEGKIEVDTEAIISKPETLPDKIRNKSSEIWQITPDGKKIEVPKDYENMLFDEEMYLCTHVYRTADWKEKTDVYFWCGSKVSSSDWQDAQVFARSAARSAGGSLVSIAQGKEPYNLFEALGGILIVRNGHSDRLSSPWRDFMLCGRQHMGQIIFDEVPFEKSVLCSGYPYLVCKMDKMFLWKGKGSTTPEISSAMLTGNIISSTNGIGEVKEIVEGHESADFWKLFSDSDSQRPALDVDWSIKATAKNFRTRLFHVEVDARPKSSGSGFMSWGRRGSAPEPSETTSASIKEMSPFSQQDIGVETICVLDTFFKVIVIVPKGASPKLGAFRAALFFAQEYGILAASLGDRAFIPAGCVEFGAGSEDLQTAFRQWVPLAVPLKEGREAIDLKDALQAM